MHVDFDTKTEIYYGFNKSTGELLLLYFNDDDDDATDNSPAEVHYEFIEDKHIV